MAGHAVEIDFLWKAHHVRNCNAKYYSAFERQIASLEVGGLSERKTDIGGETLPVDINIMYMYVYVP